MTTHLSPNTLINEITQELGLTEINDLGDSILVKTDELLPIVTFLKNIVIYLNLMVIFYLIMQLKMTLDLY